MKSLAIAHAMKKRMKKECHGGAMADGGEVMDKEQDSGYVSHPDQDDDMVMRIMRKRYAAGGNVGEIANDTPPIADSMPADYDDLVLDDNLDGKDDSSNEHGDEAEDHDRKDIVAKVMKSRAKKDKNPRPA